ncbi:MAG: DUF2878 domain-containing protein [Pseudomonadota bacterium]
MKTTIINIVLFKLGWVACVLGAARDMAWVGLVAVAVIAAVHLALASSPRREMVVLAAAAVVGVVWESLLVNQGLLDYGQTSSPYGVAPNWIVAMWVLFATTLNVSMNWLKKHPLLAVVAGGVGGPMAFVAGEKMGAVQFSEGLLSLTVIGIGWALLLPLLVSVSRRFNGHATPSRVGQRGVALDAGV